MDLLIPGTGLFLWQLIIFVILFFLLKKFAWKPILQSLKIREESIQNALDSAEKAKEEMGRLQAENEKLLEEARVERDRILTEAREVANTINEEAKEEARKSADKMIAEAKIAIDTEKQAALADVKTMVAELSLQVSEKLIRKRLSDDASQKALIEDFVKDLKLN